jgi:hypothetical protein
MFFAAIQSIALQILPCSYFLQLDIQNLNVMIVALNEAFQSKSL